MPEPDWAVADYDPSEPPHVGSEIIGRGPQSRKSKTYIPDLQLATHLSWIRDHAYHLMDLFRKLHARHYTVSVEVKNRHGETVTEVRPHILTDDEVRQIYPAVAWWEKIHQEAVEHYASIKGFSVMRATGAEEENLRSRREDSSAGADRKQPRGSEPRWK